jgi:murein DD-endopeptidase MepM/ murein hydrolase activator NlpD
MKKAAAFGLVLVFMAPASILLSVATVGATNSAAVAACLPGSLIVTGVPDSLTVTTKNGATFTLNRQQLTHAATIITVGGQINGVGRPGVVIALMAALTESTLRMYANSGAYPESLNYPHDADGSDHDSLGLFQMRPVAGWGTVAQLMDPTYQARAFYGGPDGPNFPSPRGLLDIPNWQSLDPGAAAQAVEVSAYPDRYQNFQPVAEAILQTLTQPTNTSGGTGGAPVVPETTRIVFPLPEGTWVRTSGFGTRTDPVTGEPAMHTGSDFAAPDGTPILAVADGLVVFAGNVDSGYGNLIIIEHTVDGARIFSAYAHMWDTGIHVTAGQSVTAGQHIADVGSNGKSTGAHLHLEIRPGGAYATAIDADQWLTTQGAEGISAGDTAPPLCTGTGTGGA